IGEPLSVDGTICLLAACGFALALPEKTCNLFPRRAGLSAESTPLAIQLIPPSAEVPMRSPFAYRLAARRRTVVQRRFVRLQVEFLEDGILLIPAATDRTFAQLAVVTADQNGQ